MHISGFLLLVSVFANEYAKNWRHFLKDVHLGLVSEDMRDTSWKNFYLAVNRNDTVHFEPTKLCSENIGPLTKSSDWQVSYSAIGRKIADIRGHCLDTFPHQWIVKVYGIIIRTAITENLFKDQLFEGSLWAKRKFIIKDNSELAIYGLLGGAFLMYSNESLPADYSALYTSEDGRSYAGKEWEALHIFRMGYTGAWPLQYVLDAKDLLLQLDGEAILNAKDCSFSTETDKYQISTIADFTHITLASKEDVLLCLAGKYVVLLNVDEKNLGSMNGTLAKSYSFRTIQPSLYPDIAKNMGDTKACGNPHYNNVLKAVEDAFFR